MESLKLSNNDLFIIAAYTHELNVISQALAGISPGDNRITVEEAWETFDTMCEMDAELVRLTFKALPEQQEYINTAMEKMAMIVEKLEAIAEEN